MHLYNKHGLNSGQELNSGEFRKGNLSGLLRDSSGSQFRALKRGESSTRSKENLVDMSITSIEFLQNSKGMTMK